MTYATERADSIQKVNELIKDIQIAMLTTIDSEGILHSRPMGTQQVEFDGDLWFFADSTSGKAAEIEQNSNVNVIYASPEHNRYVSVSGKALVTRDKDKIEELWNPIYKAWFPDGLDSPELALIKVSVDQIEYWDSPSDRVAQIVGFMRSVTTGQQTQANPGENETITLK